MRRPYLLDVLCCFLMVLSAITLVPRNYSSAVSTLSSQGPPCERQFDFGDSQHLRRYEDQILENRISMRKMLESCPLTPSGFLFHPIPQFDTKAFIQPVVKIYIIIRDELPDAIANKTYDDLHIMVSDLSQEANSASHGLDKLLKQMGHEEVPSLRHGRFADAMRYWEDIVFNTANVHGWPSFWSLLTFQRPQPQEQQRIAEGIALLTELEPWRKKYQKLDDLHLGFHDQLKKVDEGRLSQAIAVLSSFSGYLEKGDRTRPHDKLHAVAFLDQLDRIIGIDRAAVS